MLPLEFTALLVKGRRNYLSRRRLDTALGRADSLFNEPADFDQLRQIRDWVTATSDGSLSDLTFRPLPRRLGRSCQRQRQLHGPQLPDLRAMPLLRRPPARAECPAPGRQSRPLLQRSGVAARRASSILPEHESVVFDEAHTLEAVAGDHLGLSVTSGQVEYTLNKLYNDRTNKGLLVHHHCAEAQRQVLDCHTGATTFSTICGLAPAADFGNNGRVRSPGIVENALSPALAGLANSIDHAAQNASTTNRAAGPRRRRDRLLALAGEIQQWLEQQLRRRRPLAGGQPGASRPAADLAGRRPRSTSDRRCASSCSTSCAASS